VAVFGPEAVVGELMPPQPASETIRGTASTLGIRSKPLARNLTSMYRRNSGIISVGWTVLTAKNRQSLCGEYIGIEVTQSDFYGVYRKSHLAFAAEKPDIFPEHGRNQLKTYLMNSSSVNRCRIPRCILGSARS
jgi:hypothetical protein